MTETSKSDIWAELRKPFDKKVIGQLPKPTKKENAKGKCGVCGGWHGLPAVHLDYVGHAAVTDRLNSVDPTWTWVPMATSENGLPLADSAGNLWIKLTVGGVTRPGVGDGDSMKEKIGDALRNAAMRFGVALDLWSKEELESHIIEPELKNEKPSAKQTIDPPAPEEPSVQVDEDLGKKKEDRVALVKRMHALLKEHGYTTIEEAEPVYIEVLGKKGATTVGETKEVIKYLEAK